MYILYALAGAVFASLGTIFAKLGLKGVDSNLLTVIRGIVMAIVVLTVALSMGKVSASSLSSLTTKQWVFVILSGLGGALSWLFFYYALSVGPTVPVTVIDKLSIVITAILAVIILSEKLNLQSIIGLVFVFTGTLLVAIPFEKIIAFFKH